MIVCVLGFSDKSVRYMYVLQMEPVLAGLIDDDGVQGFLGLKVHFVFVLFVSCE